MRNPYLWIVLFVLTFTGGFYAGRKTTAQPLAPVVEEILDDAGSRIIERQVTDKPLKPLAALPITARVISDITATIQDAKEPNRAPVELHIQEIETKDGPRIVIEAPEGFTVTKGTETRRAAEANTGSGRFSLGIAARAGATGAAPGLAAGYAWKNWQFGAIGFKDQAILTASIRF